MNKLLQVLSLFILGLPVSAQNLTDFDTQDKIIEFDASRLPFGGGKTGRYALSDDILFPNADGKLEPFTFSEDPFAETEVKFAKTFKGVSKDKKTVSRILLASDGLMNGIMHNSSGYYFIEPVSGKKNQYRIYSLDSIDDIPFECGSLAGDTNDLLNKSKMRKTVGSPFPFGDKLRKYRLAVAATGEFVQHYGTKTVALTHILSFVNAINLIYELELSISFELIPATTNGNILFDNPATDPFTPNNGFASAYASQDGFDYMHTQGILNYNAYDVGHTLHVYSAGGSSARGMAGPTPCDNPYKSYGWTEWSTGTKIDLSLGMVVKVTAHEIGHQFGADHTFNAEGGSSSNPSFCTNGWSGFSAVELGSGTTLMGYQNNCTIPVNYTISGASDSRDHRYFHTFSVKKIYDLMDSYAGCFTQVSTANHPPQVTVSPSITIPKGTPFLLRGSATDEDGDQLLYSWDQMDLATSGDKGAMGINIFGDGGYPAVYSTSAPLFRSKISPKRKRVFPDMYYILKNDNKPADNVGEHLSEVARTLHFNFTARDFNLNGGGVDSKPVEVTVANVGPLKVTSYNSPGSIMPPTTVTFTWDVNGTNTIAPTVDILFSVDGGESFPYVLKKGTDNDGSESVSIPAFLPESKNARVKVVAVINEYAEFFDINNADITINSIFCYGLQNTYLSQSGEISGVSGDAVFNLGLSSFSQKKFDNKKKGYVFDGSNSSKMAVYSDNTKTSCYVDPTWTVTTQVVKFSVDFPGNYSIKINAPGNSPPAFPFSVFTSPTNLDCADFLASNAYFSSGSISWGTIANVTLESFKDYYVRVFFNNPGVNFSLEFSGPGEIYETVPLLNYYTYFAVDQSDDKVEAVSATSDFTSLGAGNYKVYGLNYAAGYDPTVMIGMNLSSALVMYGKCKVSSSNFVELHISPGANPCPPVQTLTGIAVDGKIQASDSINSTQVINPGKDVTYQAAQSILLIPETGSGFMVESGAVFKAEIKNCD